MSPRPDRDRARTVALGAAVVIVSFAIYWLSNRAYDAGRGDLFYLADAFVHGRTWLQDAATGAPLRLGTWDVIPVNGHFYVPFAPFPAVLFMPLVAITGPVVADQWETGINALLAAVSVGLAWWLTARIGVRRTTLRLWLVALFGFSTQIWWVTTRGGVWHTGHLVATILTLGCLIELWGKQRALLVGLLAGAAFLTRAPLALAIPFYALFWLPDDWQARARYVVRSVPWRRWTWYAVGIVPSIAFFFWYNAARFGSPLESGYALATLPEWLELQRRDGLFAVIHVPMNLDYLLIHLPALWPDPPFFRPDGLGMSVLITSPGLLLGLRAPWQERRAWVLAGAAIAVLIPTLLYYGGGWLQYGYRYFLDSIPFVFALCAMAVAASGRLSWVWRGLIAWGVLMGLFGVYWAYHL